MMVCLQWMKIIQIPKIKGFKVIVEHECILIFVLNCSLEQHTRMETVCVYDFGNFQSNEAGYFYYWKLTVYTMYPVDEKYSGFSPSCFYKFVI